CWRSACCRSFCCRLFCWRSPCWRSPCWRSPCCRSPCCRSPCCRSFCRDEPPEPSPCSDEVSPPRWLPSVFPPRLAPPLRRREPERAASSFCWPAVPSADCCPESRPPCCRRSPLSAVRCDRDASCSPDPAVADSVELGCDWEPALLACGSAVFEDSSAWVPPLLRFDLP